MKKLTKQFSRDYSLAMLEIWYNEEALNPKPWNNKKQPNKPYIVFIREDKTVESYYDKQGINWIKNNIKQAIKKDENFIKFVANQVRKEIGPIQEIYEKEKILSKKELIKFIDDFQTIYPWIETLWWICHLHDEGELKNINFNEILKLRKETEKISSGTDIVTKRSLKKIFPKIKEYVHVLTLKEINSKKLPTIEELKKRDKGFIYSDNQFFSSLKKVEEKYNVNIDKPQIKTNNKTTWKIFRSRYVPAVLPIYNYWSWTLKDIVGVGKTVNVWDKGNYKAIWEEKGFENAAKYAFNFLKNNLNNFNIIRKKGISSGQEVIEICKRFAKKVEKANFKEFMDFLEDLDKAHNNFTKHSMLLWVFIDAVIQKKLEKELKTYSDKEKKEIFNIMSQPKEKSYGQIEEEEFEKLLEIAKIKGINNIATKEKIKEFSEKYFWFPFEYVGPEIWNKEKVTQRIIESLKSYKKYEKLKNIEKLQKECIKKFNLSKKLIELYSIIQITTLMQDDRKMTHSQICYYLNNIILGNLSKKLNVTIEQIRYLDPNLMRKFVKDQNLEKIQKELKEREKFLVITQIGPIGKSYTGKIAKQKLKELNLEFNENMENITELKGQIANPGKIKGKVRILKTSNNVTNFKEGEILVTGMTTPDFVPLMKKASAIITDEGGITSHAAIVSRELNIPCIIGTTNATKVLRNEDFVEVDADKGIVKILEKAK